MQRLKYKLTTLLAIFITVFAPIAAVPAYASAFSCDKDGNGNTPSYCCGKSGDDQVATAINFGCSHKGTAAIDVLFAIIRFLSAGVGMVIVASLVWAGIQYSAARSDPNAVAAARSRIYNTVIALIVFIFGYALLNYLVPMGFSN